MAREVQARQVCVLPIDAIAPLAGVSRSTVKNALRIAPKLGLIEVRERRRPGLPSLTNVVRVIDSAWLGWLRLRGGVKSLTARHAILTRLDAPCTMRGTNQGTNQMPGIIKRYDAQVRIILHSTLKAKLYRAAKREKVPVAEFVRLAIAEKIERARAARRPAKAATEDDLPCSGDFAPGRR